MRLKYNGRSEHVDDIKSLSYRKKACDGCEMKELLYSDLFKMGYLRCGACGCPIATKVLFGSCPLGKW